MLFVAELFFSRDPDHYFDKREILLHKHIQHQNIYHIFYKGTLKMKQMALSKQIRQSKYITSQKVLR